VAALGGRQQYFLYQAPLLDYVVFNTNRPLFRNVRLRRAVNYAIDRRALAAPSRTHLPIGSSHRPCPAFRPDVSTP
jgi:ABC-type transport system substrate-binding protein